MKEDNEFLSNTTTTNDGRTTNEDNEFQSNTTTTSDGRMLTGMFPDRESTENAYDALHKRGYSKDEINLVMSDKTRNDHFSKGDSEIGTKAMGGAGTGSAIGGSVGAVVGLIAAIGTNVLVPGLGLVIAGPIVAGLAGAGAGGMVGGLVGALIGLGIPEERAKLYESGVKDGKVVMGVHPRNEDDARYFKSDWTSKKGEQVYY